MKNSGKGALVWAFGIALCSSALAQNNSSGIITPPTSQATSIPIPSHKKTYKKAHPMRKVVKKMGKMEKERLYAEEFFTKPNSEMTEDKARAIFKKIAGTNNKLAKADLKALDRYDEMQKNPIIQTLESIWYNCLNNLNHLGHISTASSKKACQNAMRSCGWPFITSDASFRAQAMLGISPAKYNNLKIDDVQSLDACMAQQIQNYLTEQ